MALKKARSKSAKKTTNDQRSTTNDLAEVTYYINGKKKSVKAKVITNPFQKALGLMFQIHPKPLFFTNNLQTYNPITSIFCKPFTAIWLDEKMRATKVIEVKNWKLHISGKGKHLLEIPLLPKKSKNTKISRREKSLNRKTPSINQQTRGTKEVNKWEK